MPYSMTERDRDVYDSEMLTTIANEGAKTNALLEQILKKLGGEDSNNSMKSEVFVK